MLMTFFFFVVEKKRNALRTKHICEFQGVVCIHLFVCRRSYNEFKKNKKINPAFSSDCRKAEDSENFEIHPYFEALHFS